MSKGWVIDFTKAEKGVLYRFMGLYVGSLFLLFGVIAYLFYTLGYSYILDESRHAMQLQAHELSSQIIFAHMNHKETDLESLAKSTPYRALLVDKEGQPVAGDRTLISDTSIPFIVNNTRIQIVDRSTFGHLGIDAIILEDIHFGQKVARLRKNILFWLLLVYGVVLIVGYFLARLFIRPIQMRRRQLDNFIKESTHELNTPIAALLMSVDAKSSHDKNDARIKISAKRISDIYRDLTYLFLYDKNLTVPKAIDLSAILHSEVEALAPLAEKKGVRFEVDLDKTCEVWMDEESARRLVSNLLSNAIKYNKRNGWVKITLKAHTLTVADSGIGIPKRQQQEIFNRFYRATELGGGFGLGLNIVYNICKRYDIKIDFDSNPANGTTFRLHFPPK